MEKVVLFGMKDDNNECCPKFDPKPWDDKKFEWKGKKFIKDKVICLFYIPLNFGQVMVRTNKLIEKSGGKMMEGLCLSYQSSPWKMEVYLAVDKNVLGTENVTIGGNFLSKVYEGSYNQMGKWMDDFGKYLKDKKMKMKKMYTWYTTCPKCVEKYGKNYVVMVAEV